MNTAAVTSPRSWIPYAALLVVTWGVWGAFSAAPSELYGYPQEMIYVIWAVTMLVPAAVITRGQRIDRRISATVRGLTIGLLGAGGQLLLFHALVIGPAYLVFPIVSVSPAVTVVLAVLLLRERLSVLALAGLGAVLVALVLFGVTSPSEAAGTGPWMPLAVGVCLAWGIQAFLMRAAAVDGVNDATTFLWMTVGGLLLVPVAIAMMGGIPVDAPWQAPVLTAATQLLNAVGALLLVMALSRGRASVVSPVTNALPPVLAILIALVVSPALPSPIGAMAIVLAVGGSTAMVYSDARSADRDRLSARS
ncbi:EamA family transporter [Microbacterium oleivorans]|uniref:EamA domain-containing protein n=1 Tax=Microbacterium oleivorans TaxID=273677 RepID=A0A177KC24_9MICO|nr:EamA family transporter [Microbacterium oleivorans]OAH50161.1 hypothetical protein AYL44_06750 [Microbacterium oleivorans]